MSHIDIKRVDKTDPPEIKIFQWPLTVPGNKTSKPRMGIYIPNPARSWRTHNPAVWVFRHRSQEQRNADKEIGKETRASVGLTSVQECVATFSYPSTHQPKIPTPDGTQQVRYRIFNKGKGGICQNPKVPLVNASALGWDLCIRWGLMNFGSMNLRADWRTVIRI